MKSKLSLFLVCILMVSLFLGACSKPDETPTQETPATPEAPVEKLIVRIGHSAPEANIYQFAAEAFKQKAEELLGADRIEVQIFPNATLGSQTEMIEAMQMGTLDGVVFGRHSQIDARLDILNLPFLFEDTEHMTKVLRGDEGAEIRKVIAEMFEAKDIKMLGMFEAGFRNITSSKKIGSMADMNGMIIRTPNTPVLMDSFTAWGANPTPIDFGELYTALQTKVVDGQENPFQIIYANKFYEAQDYLCVTNHSTICDQVQFSKKVWDSYPEDVQQALAEAGAYAANAAGEENNKRNEELLSELEKLMEVTYMPEAEVANMKAIVMEKVWPNYGTDEVSKKMIEDIQALAN